MFTRKPSFIPQEYLNDLLEEIPQTNSIFTPASNPQNYKFYDRYDNPFEAKWVLKKHIPLLEDIYALMESAMLAQYEAAGVMRDIHKHYYGLFVYQPGDFTRIHVDAGIHPISKLKKFVTLVLYLTDAEIDFWAGQRCTIDNPRALRRVATVSLQPRELIMFQNTDIAWHSVEPVTSTRIAITLSGVCSPINLRNSTLSELWQNQRERAYFVPNPDEVWTPELTALRDKRADPEKYHEVYRV